MCYHGKKRIPCERRETLDQKRYQEYLGILKEELIPAMGCTEPVAIAYAAACAAALLKKAPSEAKVELSGNIIKNAKSVTVPNTGGMKGVKAAVAAGIAAGKAEKELQVLSEVKAEDLKKIEECLNSMRIFLEEAPAGRVFDIRITLRNDGEEAAVRIVDRHTGIVSLTYNGKDLPIPGPKAEEAGCDRDVLTTEGILEFAEEADLSDIRSVLDPQIEYNMAIAKEGLTGNYGAAIGRTLLLTYGNTVHNRARAYAAAASDARMNGCELPVIINSGSGNQGITVSVPVIVYAEELGVSKEVLYRALLVSNLSAIHIKSGIGTLSAYCGAVSAGCGAAAGIMYLHGGKLPEIAHTLVNALAIDSGVICDGAKASCAAKIATAVESGLLGMQMYLHGKEFYGGDGIVAPSVEETIRNVATLAKEGMARTDEEIIKIMLKNDPC